MTPTAAISDLDALMSNIHRRVNALIDESHEVATQWDALGQIGAQRDDHAAALLGRLSHNLLALSRFAGRVADQVETMNTAPFADA